MNDNDALKKELSNRINDILKYYNLSSRKFAIKLGLHYTTINNYVNGSIIPSTEFLVTMLKKCPEISAEWLLIGKGDMLNMSNPDVEKLKKEVYDLKMTVLVKEGIIRELHDNILMEIRKILNINKG